MAAPRGDDGWDAWSVNMKFLRTRMFKKIDQALKTQKKKNGVFLKIKQRDNWSIEWSINLALIYRDQILSKYQSVSSATKLRNCVVKIPREKISQWNNEKTTKVKKKNEEKNGKKNILHENVQ